jgi:excisionase family DNA binding protein
MQRAFLGVSEVANVLGLRPVTIYRWCRSGRLPCVKIGKEWRISRSALDDILHHNPRQRLADRTEEGVTMRDVSPATKDLAQRLLWHEAGGQLETEVLTAAAERTLAQLRIRLTILLGRAGFFALFKRALRLTQREFPLLGGVAIGQTPDDNLLGLREFGIANDGDPAAVANALTALVAQLIWLLVTFIGDDITLRLVDEIWPEIAQNAGKSPGQGWSDNT